MPRVLSRISILLLLLLLLLVGALPATALAQAPPPPSGPSAELLSAQVRRKVTDDVKRFLEERCAQQCDLGQVTVAVSRRKPPVGSAPGFEELTSDVKDYVVDRVDLDLLLDKRLPADFRAGLHTVVQKKLAADGIPAALHESLLHFPTAQELPDRGTGPQQQPQQPQAAAPPAPSRASDRETQATLPAAAERGALERFIDALPLLLGLLLCAAVVWFTLRQYQRLLEGRAVRAEAERAAPPGGGPEAEEARARARREVAQKADDLRGRLAAQRLVGREVARDFLIHGPVADTALAAAVLGPSMFDGVRNDVDCRPGFRELDAYLAERSPTDALEDRRRLLADVERRLLRAQVAHGEQPDESSFSWLRDVSPGLFAHLLADEPPPAQALILRHAPPALVQAYVERQPSSMRERLVLPLLELDAVPRDEVERLAAHFRGRLASHLAVEDLDGGNPLGELLDAVPPDERRRLFASLARKPEQLRQALRSLIVDETLAALDGEVIATAIARVDQTSAALFAGSLDEAARRHLIAALPASTARSITEEASIVTASHARRAAARRAVLAAVRAAVEERGLDLAEINRPLLLRAEEVAS